HYRRALELDRDLAGAHYGLAFLLLKRGDPDGATQHLRAFLAHPPKGPDAQKWIEHATQALRDLGASGPTQAAAAEAPCGPALSASCSRRPRRATAAPTSRATSRSKSPPPTASSSTTRSSPRRGG